MKYLSRQGLIVGLALLALPTQGFALDAALPAGPSYDGELLSVKTARIADEVFCDSMHWVYMVKIGKGKSSFITQMASSDPSLKPGMKFHVGSVSPCGDTNFVAVDLQ